MATPKPKIVSTHITLQAGFTESLNNLDFVLTQEPGGFNIHISDAQESSKKLYK